MPPGMETPGALAGATEGHVWAVPDPEDTREVAALLRAACREHITSVRARSITAGDFAAFARQSTDDELIAVVDAGAQELAGRLAGAASRKRLFWRSWQTLDRADRRSFAAYLRRTRE